MSTSRRTIAILGGGFSGVTTGVVLQLLGHPTTIYTARHADHDDPSVQHPSFASLYPAASILPNLVRVKDLEEHMRLTAAFFGRFAREEGFGVRRQHHVEAFEAPPDPPPYVPMIRNFRWLPEDGTGLPGIPRRTGAEAVYGWHGDILFAETPVYRPRLYALYRALGGNIVSRTLTPAAIRDLSHDVLVNCMGLGTLDLFDDARPHDVIRGCLLHATPPPDPLDVRDGRPLSYNYTPTASVYRTPEGVPTDVYFYPRRDTWVLGGSRRYGRMQEGTWTGEAIAGRTVEVDGHQVPAAVLELNRDLLHTLTGYDETPAVRRAVYGYRFARDLKGEGIRLETTYEHGHAVVHNYGHGGAGVTLSWSCALHVARILHTEGLLSTSDHHPVAPPSEHAALVTDLQQLAEKEMWGAER